MKFPLSSLQAAVGAHVSADLAGRLVEALAAVRNRGDAVAAAADRIAVYEAVSNLLTSVVRWGVKADEGLEIGYSTALAQAALLFDDRVHQQMVALWADYADFCQANGAMDSLPLGHQDRGHALDKRFRLMEQFGERLRTLDHMFGKELRVGGRST